MKRLVRTLGVLALGAVLVVGGMAGRALAQGEGPVECYPIPPGGCPNPQPDCPALQAALEAGQITADQLPEECRPDEEISPPPSPGPSPSPSPSHPPSPGPHEEIQPQQIADTGSPAALLLVLAATLAGVGGAVVSVGRGGHGRED